MNVYYFKLDTVRNEGFAVVFGEWPKGVLKHRGYTAKRLIYSRLATLEEESEVKRMSRYHCILYKDVQGLMEDETEILSKVGLDALKSVMSQYGTPPLSEALTTVNKRVKTLTDQI